MINTLKILFAGTWFPWRSESGIEYRLACGLFGFDTSWGRVFFTSKRIQILCPNNLFLTQAVSLPSLKLTNFNFIISTLRLP